MRFLNGLVLGFLLAIGVAYWHDRTVTDGPDGTSRELVNWEELGRTLSAVGTWVQAQIEQLTQSLRRDR